MDNHNSTDISKIDELVYQANFAEGAAQVAAHDEIWRLAHQTGNTPASIYPIYQARAAEELPATFTVPAFNLRGLSYQTTQAALRAAQAQNVGLVIFELARSEMQYSDQPPAIFASNILAAAIKVGWNQPVFIQGDHFQVKAAAPGEAKTGELEALKKLIDEALAHGFYNIDIDASTLVNLNEKSEDEQQKANYLAAAELANYVRDHSPAGITVSLGGEIGEVGVAANSRPEELQAFMNGFQEQFHHPIGLAKISVQTGTRHGGVVEADGSTAAMKVDFETIKNLSQLARHQYQMAGAVQHGASTLPRQLFSEFPRHQAIEIHLSTGFQNLILDHPAFPAPLLAEINAWCDTNCADERKPDMTDAQFHYRARKKAWGAFKKATWDIDPTILEIIANDLQKECAFYYQALGVTDTMPLLERVYAQPR
jgi:hypothetical protein